MASQDERREHVRLDVALPARLEVPGGMMPATVANISEQGARVVTTTSTGVGRGDEVLIEVGLPTDGRPLQALGWVADVQSEGRGDALSVTFFGLPEPAAERIRVLVAASSRG